MSSLYHNIIGNDRCDGLKNKEIGQSAAKLLKSHKSMEKVQRSDSDAD